MWARSALRQVNLRQQKGPGSYHFRQRLKHMNAKPPTRMPPKDKAKSPPDNQAPIIPLTAKQASNQKIQIGRLFMGDRSPKEEWRLRPSEGDR